jgi:plasmid stability protein
MPKTLTVRNVPDAVLAELRRRARRNGRSLQNELLSVLRQAALDEKSFLDQLGEMRRRLPRRVPLERIQEAIREGRP